MYYRRKILIALIERAHRGVISKIALQKILFLLCARQAHHYHFVPYKYGMYSFTAANDLRVLTQHYQLIEEKSETYRILPQGRGCFEQLKEGEKVALMEITRRHNAQKTDELIAYCYDNYPYYTINSERALSPRQKKGVAQERQRISAQTAPMLFTIGYEGIAIEEYLNKLIHNNVHVLCDVRKNPLSMKHGFSKSQLKNYCSNVGITYCHVPELGIASGQRKNLASQQDYERLFRSYKATLAGKKNAIMEVVALYKKHKRIAITCFEADVNCCHRNALAERLVKEHNLRRSDL